MLIEKKEDVVEIKKINNQLLYKIGVLLILI